MDRNQFEHSLIHFEKHVRIGDIWLVQKFSIENQFDVDHKSGINKKAGFFDIEALFLVSNVRTVKAFIIFQIEFWFFTGSTHCGAYTCSTDI